MNETFYFHQSILKIVRFIKPSLKRVVMNTKIMIFLLIMTGLDFFNSGYDIFAENNSLNHAELAMNPTGGEAVSVWNYRWPRKINPIDVVVVFSKFKGEAPGDTLAPKWADDLFTGKPGSVPHFFNTVCFGKFKVTGSYLPKRYELPNDETFYVKNLNGYAMDLLTLLDNDPEVNFKKYDNDGPDGYRGSSDDDTYVDYMVLMPLSRPYDFIFGYATGVMTMGLKGVFETSDKNPKGLKIKLDNYSGCIATANRYDGALGTIVAELSHAYGATDLMDKSWSEPEKDSAGVGYWDFISRGTIGWKEQGCPVGPSAFTRMLMNSIGLNNQNLIDLYGMHQGLRIKDTGKEDGFVYRIWISEYEYFLLEHRRNNGLYYDRKIPTNGILIWHINQKEDNNDEYMKLCDLECPDGRYIDCGYPAGKIPDPIDGGDNLDFWAHDAAYSKEHYGNLGDATDVFDGIKYTEFGSNTNPNTFSKVTKSSTRIEIYNIHPDGDEMVFDCIAPPFYNWFENKYPLIGSAFQRLTVAEFSSNSKPTSNGLYLLNYGLDTKPDVLATISGDSLTVESLSFLENIEIDFMVSKRLLKNNRSLQSSMIVRKNISLEDFEAILIDFGFESAQLGFDRNPKFIQKITIISDQNNMPIAIDLRQNFPNPFNAFTNIQYVMPSNGHVMLEVYNILGQKAMMVDEGYKEQGLHTLHFDASGLSSGIYLYRLSGKIVSKTRKFSLIK